MPHLSFSPLILHFVNGWLMRELKTGSCDANDSVGGGNRWSEKNFYQCQDQRELSGSIWPLC